MLTCFTTSAENPLPIHVVTKSDYTAWLDKQDVVTKTWLTQSAFSGEAGSISVVPANDGQIKLVVCSVADKTNLWGVGDLSLKLPKGVYQFVGCGDHEEDYAVAWGLGAYQFTRYKKSSRELALLVISTAAKASIENIVTSIYCVRDLINTPTDDLGPSELASEVEKMASEFQAKFNQIIGDDLLKLNYPAIHAVGRASDDAPRLLDMRWGNKSNPKITLVGKGVCFDTGGLDIKPSSGMRYMKKDMGGAANVLGLARMIMGSKLPVCLRVLIPAVENSISGNAYRPGDVVHSRKGLTIEIGNTDAEGRVVLADALTEAASESPDLLIDMSTLTGAARVAVGTDISAVFSSHDELVNDVIKYGTATNDPIWRLPLYAPYREGLNSDVADINNISGDGYAGATVAALFLSEFVSNEIPWLHFDMMAWNIRAKPGQPAGGEAMALRGVFAYLSNRFPLL